ncbi:MAG: FAD-binding oxidoreductase [Deltaproteobacteria bacterium]|nr:FAD-binding oxidoreductase [Deltaproteobacteria bacterium]
MSKTKSLKKGFLAELNAIVGEGGFSISEIDRVNYCRDSNFRSAIQALHNQNEHLPGVVVWPSTTEQISQLIRSAKKHQVAITPFSGGSGVCGGAISYSGGMTLDLKNLNRVLRLDSERLFIDVQTGISGLQLEKQLQRQGYTLGHFPSSILSACLGGYLAARSAGQLSSKYGKIEDMVIDLEFIDGLGRLHQTADAKLSRYLDLTQAIIGSEGTLGIITKARLKIFPYPQDRSYTSFTFKNLSYGLEAMRRIMQTGIKPDVLRLYDEIDTIMVFNGMNKHQHKTSLTHSMPNALKEGIDLIKASVTRGTLRARKLVDRLSRFSWLGSLLVVMLEGDSEVIKTQQRLITKICEDLGGSHMGEDPAIHWHKHRYSVSYKASKLFLEGAFTDTMEVATTWDNLENLYQTVHDALLPHCLVLAHISHVYEDGAAIYFTMVAPLKGPTRSLKQYDKIWDVGLNAVQKAGGVLSHHHGIGRLKKNHLVKEWGEAKAIYNHLKKNLDPDHILNPGVLIPS